MLERDLPSSDVKVSTEPFIYFETPTHIMHILLIQHSTVGTHIICNVIFRFHRPRVFPNGISGSNMGISGLKKTA